MSNTKENHVKMNQNDFNGTFHKLFILNTKMIVNFFEQFFHSNNLPKLICISPTHILAGQQCNGEKLALKFFSFHLKSNKCSVFKCGSHYL